MKTLFLIAVLVSTSAFAQYKRGAAWLDRIPDPYTDTHGMTHFGATEAMILGDGWTNVTPQEIADRAAGQAAADAAAQSNAAQQASLPMQAPPGGIETSRVILQSYTNGWGWALEAVDQGTTNLPPDTIIYLFHASPVNWDRVKANREAAIAELKAKKTKQSEKIDLGKTNAGKVQNMQDVRDSISNIYEILENK